jgi:hypothetical protein
VKVTRVAEGNQASFSGSKSQAMLSRRTFVGLVASLERDGNQDALQDEDEENGTEACASGNQSITVDRSAVPAPVQRRDTWDAIFLSASPNAQVVDMQF